MAGADKKIEIADVPFIEGPFSEKISTLARDYELADPSVNFSALSTVTFELQPTTPPYRLGTDYLVRSNVIEREDRQETTSVLQQYYESYKKLDDRAKEALNHVLGGTVFSVYFNRMREKARAYSASNVDRINLTEHFMGLVVVRHIPELVATAEDLSETG